MARKPTYEELEKRIRELEKESAKRRKAEAALRESEERFRLLSEASSEGIVITDKGVMLDANEQFAKMVGCRISELTGKRVLDFVAPESRELVLEHIAAGYEQPYEHLAQKKDGSIFPGEVHGKTIPYEGRQVRVTVISDISARKQAEEARQNAEKRYRDFFNEAPIMYVVTSHDPGVPHIAECNDLFCKTLGYTRDQILNQPLADFYTPESQNQLLQGGYQDVVEGQAVAGERHLVASDGRLNASQFEVVFLDVRLPDGDGLSAIGRIRQFIYNPEVIIITGEGDPNGAELAIKNGAWDYIQKPISPDKMTLPLNRALQYRDSLQNMKRRPWS